MTGEIGLRLMSLAGLLTMLALGWALSEARKHIDWRLVGWGIALQVILGLLFLLTPLEASVFRGMEAFVGVLTNATLEGSRMVFGALADGFTLSADSVKGGGGEVDLSYIFAFRVLPVIILVSALSSILYHLGVIPIVVSGVSWTMRRTLRTSGAETFAAALLIFLGIESVAAVRTYLQGMTRSELCTIMTTFMATIAGSVMVVYAGAFGASPGHLLTASLMSAPAAIVFAKLLVPETAEPKTSGAHHIALERDTQNVVDAAARGAHDGVQMAISVAAMLITFVAIVYLIDLCTLNIFGISFAVLVGYAFRPFALLMGVPWEDVPAVAELLGTKTVLNEFLAYMGLQDKISAGLSPRSTMIATYALCGFANPGSLGIAVAALDRLAPGQREQVASLGLKSLLGGTLACFCTACIAGVIVA